MRLRDILRTVAAPLWREPLVWVGFTLTLLLCTHYVHLPSRRVIMECLGDLWLTCLLLTVTLRLLPSRLRPWVRVLALMVFMLMAWTESFLHERFQMIYEPTMFSLITETNGQESSEFLRVCLRSDEFWRVLWPFKLVGFVAVASQAAVWAYQRYRRQRTVWEMGFFRVANVVGTVALAVLVCFNINLWIDRRGEMIDFLRMSHSGQAERTNSRPYYSSPLRLLYSVKFYGLTRQEGDSFAANTLAIRHQVPADTLSADSVSLPQDTIGRIVLVIGESYNKHHAQAYGYNKPTTPLISRMARRGQLTVFTDVVSPWNITSQVMKWMMSTESVGAGRSWADGVLWPAIFRHAGWPVAFITNQYVRRPTRNKIDYSGSFFLNTQPLDSLAFDFRNTRKYQYDGQLLCELDSLPPSLALGSRQRAPHSLVILHLIGQHMDARLRVPEHHWRWTASDYRRDDLGESERQIIADYDNATLYNDQVFARICQRFRSEDAVVIYLADHGEEVYHPEMHHYGRNHTPHPSPVVLQSEYEVPLLVWTSPRCRRHHPALVRSLRAAVHRPFMTDDICHMLLGLSRIPTPYYNPARDILSPYYDTARPRLVKGQIDYDKAMK